MSQPRGQSDACFHFPLENVIDIVEHNQISTFKMVQHIEENTSILESVQPLNISGVAKWFYRIS
jgi:hypothetical protein